jgi:putative SOS response-associated peptidase YedK
MCGRIALYSDTPQLARLLDAGVDPDLVDALEPRWNIGPTSPILGVSESQDGQRTLGAYRWGLIPWWAKDPAAIKNTFNARGETLATKSMFQSAFARSRILVPVDAFYEWKAGTPKQPFAFKRADGQPLVFAGLLDRWKGDDGIELRSATIITTHAGPDMPIHDRQPVVLGPETWEQWLDPQVTDPDGLEPLLVPNPAGTLVHYRVGRAVGNVKNDRPELLLPKEEEEEAVQGSLL